MLGIACAWLTINGGAPRIWAPEIMDITQLRISSEDLSITGSSDRGLPQQSGFSLGLVFGSTAALKMPGLLESLRTKFTETQFVGCSAAGQIEGDIVVDEMIVCTVIDFERTRIKVATAPVENLGQSYLAGESLAKTLVAPDLVHVLTFSDGLHVDGNALAGGFRENLPNTVAVTGGLAGDGERFSETVVVSPEGVASQTVVAVGLYGENLEVGYGSLGGWDFFGLERTITKAIGPELFELDGQSALALYKRYLGEFAAELPAAGLRFPLGIRESNSDIPVVRTILSIDESAGSMTFAGAMPEGARARFMKANTDHLVDAAMEAANASVVEIVNAQPDLALLISCVGRRIVLGQRVEEEISAAVEKLGAQAKIVGFYSYGELAPFRKDMRCALHNQTMTITTFREVRPPS